MAILIRPLENLNHLIFTDTVTIDVRHSRDRVDVKAWLQTAPVLV
jgi:hypothetical protein